MLATILLLLLVVSSLPVVSLLHINAVNIISELDNIFNFKTVIFFSNQDFDVDVNDLLKEIEDNLCLPVLRVSNNESCELKEVVDMEILSMVFFGSIQDNGGILTVVDKSLRVIHSSKIFFWPKGEVNPSDVFKWAWKRLMINAIVMINNQLFTYDPFPNIEITPLPLTGFSKEQVFPNDNLTNLKGFSIRTPFVEVIPRSFTFTDSRGKQVKSGYTVQVFRSFMTKMNATVEEISLKEDADFNKAIQEEFSDDSIDISMLPLAFFNRSAIQSSYPLTSLKMCIMVPIIHESAPYLLLVNSFKTEAWIAILVTIVLLPVLIYLAFRIARTTQDFSLWEAFAHVFTAILYLPAPNEFFRDRQQFRLPVLVFIYLKLQVFSFIIYNLYVCYMHSLHAATEHPLQINTLEEIIDRGDLKLMSVEFALDQLRNYAAGSERLRAALERHTIAVNISTLDIHLNRANTSYAYLWMTDSLMTVLNYQKLMKRPLLRITDICTDENFLVYPIEYESYLMNPLKDFILLVQQSGLLYYWESRNIDEMVAAGFIKRVPEWINEWEPLDVDSLRILWISWSCGMFLGCVVLLGEIIFNYRCRRQ